MLVKELMCKAPVALEENEPVSAAARLMRSRNIGVLPVTGRGGALVGMLTDRDIVTRCAAAGADVNTVRIGDIMTRGAVTAGADEPLEAAMAKMQREQIRRLPVTDSGKLVGILSIADIARTGRHSMETANALCDITSNVCRK